MRDDLTSSSGSGMYTPFSKNVDKFIEQLKSKNPNAQSRTRAPSPSMQDWKVIPGTFQGTPQEEMSLLRSDAFRSPSPSVNGQDTSQALEWQNAKRSRSTNLTQLVGASRRRTWTGPGSLLTNPLVCRCARDAAFASQWHPTKRQQ